MAVHDGTVPVDTCVYLRVTVGVRDAHQIAVTLTLVMPPTKGVHHLCLFITSDSRDGLWAIGKIELLTH